MININKNNKIEFPFNKLVIWGLRKKWHTHRFIHKAFYENAKKLGIKTIWVEDDKKNQKCIEPGDLIIASEVVGKMVPQKEKLEDYNLPIRDDIKYCLHNYQDIFKDNLKKENYINLVIYTKEADTSDIKIDVARYFDTKSRSLYQPWGTDLLVEEFKKPVYNTNRFVFWIGSVWNDSANRGNVLEIKELLSAINEFGLRFIKLRFVPDFLNRFFIRRSRIAPAIGGNFQVKVGYLPCRVFKNISYGQLGITNIKNFKNILGDDYVDGDSIKEIISNSLKLSKEKYIEMIKKQQNLIKKYTYRESLENIISRLK